LTKYGWLVEYLVGAKDNHGPDDIALFISPDVQFDKAFEENLLEGLDLKAVLIKNR